MSIDDAVLAVRRGLVVGLPTDTVYGIGADPFRKEALARLYAVKGRPESKAIPILAADLDGVRRVAELSPEVAAQATRHWPGAVTLVLPRTEAAPPWVGDPERATVAVRIPAHDDALALLGRCGPLAVTSANLSGEPPVTDAEAAKVLLGERVAVFVPGVSPGGHSSTVVDLTGPKAIVLRPGPVVWEDT
jgi:L-threonylcarbamoyladenylate synthase